jgi:hypothetical protein
LLASQKRPAAALVRYRRKLLRAGCCQAPPPCRPGTSRPPARGRFPCRRPGRWVGAPDDRDFAERPLLTKAANSFSTRDHLGDDGARPDRAVTRRWWPGRARLRSTTLGRPETHETNPMLNEQFRTTRDRLLARSPADPHWLASLSTFAGSRSNSKPRASTSAAPRMAHPAFTASRVTSCGC